MITGKNYVGNTLSAKGTKTFTTFNPQTNTENTFTITEATSEEIHQAAELAASAFQRYSKKTGKEKAVFLRAIADEIEALGDAYGIQFKYRIPDEYTNRDQRTQCQQKDTNLIKKILYPNDSSIIFSSHANWYINYRQHFN